MKILSTLPWVKIGIVAAAVIIAAVIVYSSTNPSGAFTLIGLDRFPAKIYVATQGHDANDGKTPQTPVRSLRRALSLEGMIIVVMGPTYELPLMAEHVDGGTLTLGRGAIFVSDQTPWEQSPSSASGGCTEILPARNPNGTFSARHVYVNMTGQQMTSESATMRFLSFSRTELRLRNVDNTSVKGC